MKIAFNPSTVAALITPPNNKDITFDLRGRNIFARGVKFCGTDTNTWRDIKINNVSIGSNILDLRNGSNTTLTNTNGIVTINSTWRPVVDNLTSDSTTSSLSAKQGKILKSLIDGKSNSDHNHDGRYLRLNGSDTMQGNLYLHSHGTSYIGRGLGDKSGADFTEANIVIRSWWGISFKSYDDIVRTYIDTRTGNIGTKGVLNAVGAVIQGRVYNGGDDEGIIVKPSSNGYAGLILGTHNGERSVFYLTKGNPFWRYNNGSTNLDIQHPKKPGVIALTSDIPSSLKNPYSLTTFGVVYDGSSAKTVTTSTFVSQLSEGTSTVTDGTMLITSWASNSGFADTNAVNVPYKRKAIHLWEYIKAKTDSLYALTSHNHDGRYVRAFGTSNDNIDSDWGQSFKTFDPIPSGTPPEQNPNISILNIGNNFNRRKQLAFIYNNDNIYYRRHVDNSFTNWRRIAFANEIPTSLKNPYALTISLNGTSQGPYDGSAAKNINITPSSIGAATSGHNHDSYYVKYGKVVKSTTDNANVTPYLYNVENEEVISGYYKYWYIFNMGQYSGGNFGTQIAMPYQDSLADSELFIRSAKSGSWRTWRRILHSNNYTAYTVTKNGTGANGTWGISITGNADTVDGYHISDESRQVYRNYYTVASPASAWILIKFPAWNANNEIVAIDGQGDNRHATCIVHCGSRNQGIWGYQSDYNGKVVDRIRWKGVDSGKFALVVLINEGITNLSIKSTSSLEISKTTEDNAAFAISSSFFSSSGVFHGNVDWDKIIGKPSSFIPSAHDHNYVLDIANNNHTTFAYSKPGISKDSITWLAVWNGYELRAMNKDQIALSGHTHDDRYYTKAESNAKYITDITTSVNKLTFTKNGSNITRDIRVNNVQSLGRRNPLTERNAISGIYTYGTYSDTDNLAPSSYFETLGFGEGAGGTIEIGGSWISGGKLYWRALRDCCEDWFSWRTVLDDSNYTSILNNTYLPLAGGTMNGNARIGHGSGSLYIGNSGNDGWIYTQDIASQLGTASWNIRQSGAARFGRIHIASKNDESANNNVIESDTGVSLHLNYFNNENITLCNGGGSVGIGTTAPTQRLDVHGNIRATGQLYLPTNGNYNAILMGDNCWMGDCNIGDVIGLSGRGNANAGGIKFGRGGMHIGYNGSNHYSSGTSLWSNFNADLLDGYHYNDFTYKKYIGYNRNGPYNMKIFSKDISSITWGASYLIFDIFSSGYNSNRVYFGKYEVSLGHWNNTDKNPTVYSRWIFKTNSAYDCVHVIKDLSNYTVDVYIENNLWDCSMGLSIIAIDGFKMVPSSSWVNLPSASGTVQLIGTTYLSFMGNADMLDGYHASELFTALSNSNNGISITVGGTTKSISNISVNYAASAGYANGIANKGLLDSQEKIDNFITANRFEYATFKTTESNNVGLVSNDGMILSIPWDSTKWGAQIAFDDATSSTVKVRSKDGNWGNWYTLLHSGNYNSYSPTLTGTGASGTWDINITGNADTVDGYHATDGRTFTGNINWSGNWNDAWSDGTNKHPWYGFDHRYPNTGAYSTTISDYFGMTIKTALTLRLDFRTLLLNGTSIYSINVASATKLQTARKIWGQSFDGTGDVSGSLVGTGTITASAAATYDIGSNTLDYRYGYFQWIGAKSNTNLRLAANNSDNQIVLHTNGNVGIGTNAPTYKLDVVGNIRATGNSYATHFYESSDKTLKKNIKSILSSANIPKIREFDWEDTGEHSYGFIAQELEEQGYGCLVSEANGKKTVNYTATLALTVAKLQNLINIQNKKISNLTKELKALKYGRKKNS